VSRDEVSDNLVSSGLAKQHDARDERRESWWPSSWHRCHHHCCAAQSLSASLRRQNQLLLLLLCCWLEDHPHLAAVLRNLVGEAVEEVSGVHELNVFQVAHVLQRRLLVLVCACVRVCVYVCMCVRACVRACV
jgi:hypothetical protein